MVSSPSIREARLRIYTPLLFLLSNLLSSHAVQAQALKGSLVGSVADASGKPVSGVSLTLISDVTARKRTTVTDSRGEFVISLLAPGTYRLEAEREGFRKHVQPVELRVDQEIRLDIPLLAGQRTEQVTVTAQRGTVRTDSAALGAMIENRQIQGLPLNGRNFLELSLLTPGTVPAAPGSAGSVRGDLAINVNGAREDSNAFLLDGVYNGDPKLNTVAVTPPVDAIQEFEVLTSAYDSSFGRNSGGQVNVIVKSG